MPATAAFTPNAPGRWAWGPSGRADQRAKQDDVLAALDEAQPRELADKLAVGAGVEAEMELLKRFDPGKPRLLEPAPKPLLVAPAPFLRQRLSKELPVVQVLLAGLLAKAVQCCAQMLHLESIEYLFQAYCTTSS